ncbi:Putative peptidyl-prolyl cis-trans isomerase, FkbP family protein [gamma proteobacterium HdN1]|nr:Putative peptidyl-prolyl cis-trans isomerase, FkbP family protein [gamma proteobacterium HdN1]
MQVADNKVVSFHYTLKDPDGNEKETSRDDEPLTYLHGADNIVPGLEKALIGKSVGDRLEVVVPPADGYGEHRDDRKMRVSVKHLAWEGKLRAGIQAYLNTEHGPIPVSVIKAGKFMVDIDTNHPLAGATLVFDVEITDIREATPEELEHKHAHGPGGHHH